MQTLGIELRKTNNISLYRDVDRILSQMKYPIVQASTVAHSLQKMFGATRHFDVCCIRDCAKACNVIIKQEHMDIYSAIHCLDWSAMLPEYREYIMAMVLDDFRGVLLYDQPL